MTDADPIRAAALTLLADIAAGRHETAVAASERAAAMGYLLDSGWIGELGEITAAGRAALAQAGSAAPC